MIYFIQAMDGGPVKIGCSDNPQGRLINLQFEHHRPLRILGLLNGGRARESLLHRYFAHLRVYGEWFEPNTELLGFISNPDLEKLKSCAVPIRRARRLSKQIKKD